MVSFRLIKHLVWVMKRLSFCLKYSLHKNWCKMSWHLVLNTSHTDISFVYWNSCALGRLLSNSLNYFFLAALKQHITYTWNIEIWHLWFAEICTVSTFYSWASQPDLIFSIIKGLRNMYNNCSAALCKKKKRARTQSFAAKPSPQPGWQTLSRYQWARFIATAVILEKVGWAIPCSLLWFVLAWGCCSVV